MSNTTPTIDTAKARITSVLAELSKQFAERKDELDLPRTMTQRQVNEYLAETIKLDRKIAAIRDAAAQLAEMPSEDADRRWLCFLANARATISAELLDIKSPIRNKAVLERSDRLMFSLDLIDRGWSANRMPVPIIDLSSTRLGELMTESGYATAGPALHGPNGFGGSIKEVEDRQKASEKQRADAEAALDQLLIDDETRSERDAEHSSFRAVLATMQIKYNGTGDGLIAFTPDGEVLRKSEMTAAQREAFEWSERATFPHRQVS